MVFDPTPVVGVEAQHTYDSCLSGCLYCSHNCVSYIYDGEITEGQHFSVGDSDTQFCIQSCSKPITYLIAQTEFGPEYVHKSVGTEPSGMAFNAMTLKPAPVEGDATRRIPHNPCINAGAIMAVSMAYPSIADRDERRGKIMKVWEQLAGPDADVGYSKETYESESATADRNWCLGYMMKNDRSFPPCFTNLEDTLELYFQVCSLQLTNMAMSRLAAPFANGGLNPMSGERIFAADHVRNALPIMMMAGMYDYSGQWAFDIGLPAKSGVGGCVFIVVPNVCGTVLGFRHNLALEECYWDSQCCWG
jgi:glutaminase